MSAVIEAATLFFTDSSTLQCDPVNTLIATRNGMQHIRGLDYKEAGMTPYLSFKGTDLPDEVLNQITRRVTTSWVAFGEEEIRKSLGLPSEESIVGFMRRYHTNILLKGVEDFSSLPIGTRLIFPERPARIGPGADGPAQLEVVEKVVTKEGVLGLAGVIHQEGLIFIRDEVVLELPNDRAVIPLSRVPQLQTSLI